MSTSLDRLRRLHSLRPQHAKPEPVYAPLELLRFAIPRRVYTRSHLDYIGESAVLCMKEAELIRGLRVKWAPPVLRHFMAQLEEV